MTLREDETVKRSKFFPCNAIGIDNVKLVFRLREAQIMVSEFYGRGISPPHFPLPWLRPGLTCKWCSVPCLLVLFFYTMFVCLCVGRLYPADVQRSLQSGPADTVSVCLCVGRLYPADVQRPLQPAPADTVFVCLCVGRLYPADVQRPLQSGPADTVFVCLCVGRLYPADVQRPLQPAPADTMFVCLCVGRLYPADVQRSLQSGPADTMFVCLCVGRLYPADVQRPLQSGPADTVFVCLCVGRLYPADVQRPLQPAPADTVFVCLCVGRLYPADVQRPLQSGPTASPGGTRTHQLSRQLPGAQRLPAGKPAALLGLRLVLGVYLVLGRDATVTGRSPGTRTSTTTTSPWPRRQSDRPCSLRTRVWSCGRTSPATGCILYNQFGVY